MPDTMSVDAYRELLNRQEREEVGKSHRKNYLTESLIQQACVQWFHFQYPAYDSLLFAVPNGARRSHATASRMKAEGMVSGVADLILLVPRGRFASLCIEMKTRRAGSKQGDRQKSWQQDAEAVGNKYVFEGGKKEAPFYMVYVDGGRGPTKMHDTMQEATEEADRLAKINNRRTYVLAACMLIEPEVITHGTMIIDMKEGK